MNIRDNYKNLNLNNENEAKDHISNKLKELNEKCECNIFIHHIWPMRRPFNKEKGAMRESYESILKYGIEYKNESLSSTLSHLGNTKDLNIDELLNYKFLRDFTKNYLVIYALPKEIEIEGVKINDFSTPMKNVLKRYDVKNSIADVTFKNHIPNEYIFAGLIVEKTNNRFQIDFNKNLILNREKDKSKNFLKKQLDELLKELSINSYDLIDKYSKKIILQNDKIVRQKGLKSIEI